MLASPGRAGRRPPPRVRHLRGAGGVQAGGDPRTPWRAGGSVAASGTCWRSAKLVAANDLSSSASSSTTSGSVPLQRVTDQGPRGNALQGLSSKPPAARTGRSRASRTPHRAGRPPAGGADAVRGPAIGVRFTGDPRSMPDGGLPANRPPARPEPPRRSPVRDCRRLVGEPVEAVGRYPARLDRRGRGRRARFRATPGTRAAAPTSWPRRSPRPVSPPASKGGRPSTEPGTGAAVTGPDRRAWHALLAAGRGPRRGGPGRGRSRRRRAAWSPGEGFTMPAKPRWQVWDVCVGRRFQDMLDLAARLAIDEHRGYDQDFPKRRGYCHVSTSVVPEIARKVSPEECRELIEFVLGGPLKKGTVGISHETVDNPTEEQKKQEHVPLSDGRIMLLHSRAHCTSRQTGTRGETAGYRHPTNCALFTWEQCQ